MIQQTDPTMCDSDIDTAVPVQNNPMTGIKAVLWDMDGTLVLSDKLHEKAIKEIGRKFGYDVDDAFCKMALGVSHDHCYEMLQKTYGDKVQLNFEDWRTLEISQYHELLPHIEPRADVLDVVQKLHEQGIKQAIFSNNPRHVINMTMKSIESYLPNAREIFEVIISLDDDVPRKPDRAGYLMAAEKLDVVIDDCLVIEDSATGLKSGLAAGAKTLLWVENEHAIQDKSPKPDYLVIGNHNLKPFLFDIG